MPRADMLPNFEIALEEVPCKTNPIGVKGIGESGTIGAPPVVINAVIDALRPLGIDHIDMPATPGRVWAAIQSREAARRRSLANISPALPGGGRPTEGRSGGGLTCPAMSKRTPPQPSPARLGNWNENGRELKRVTAVGASDKSLLGAARRGRTFSICDSPAPGARGGSAPPAWLLQTQIRLAHALVLAQRRAVAR